MGAERVLQTQCIGLFEGLGYEFLDEKTLAELRENNTNEVLLKDILREKLRELNKNKFSENSIENAIKLLQNSQENLTKTNAKITDTLLLGESFSQSVGGAKKSLQMRFIDFENPQNNAFHIAEEVAVSCVAGAAKKTRRADLVVFINGIAVAVLELKSAMRDYKMGIRQLLRYQEQIPQLFSAAALCVAGNNHHARYGAVGTSEKFYALWREQDEENSNLAKNLQKNFSECELKSLLCSLFEKTRLLRLMRHYILFDKGEKKIARYQQFFAVQRVLERVEVLENDKRKGGLIWHTQGSGKSLTMVFLTRLLAEKFTQSRVIIVTDRVDLDRQIRDTFQNSEVRVEQAKSGAHLLELLQSGAGVITAVVHKFETAMKTGARFEGREIFVLVDEAHRSHAKDKLKKSETTLHEKMKKTLPNACYIGFTGTPLLKRERDRFGEILHKYTIKNGVDDGAIVPLIYEGRLAKQKARESEINERFDDISAALSEPKKQALREKWAQFSKVAGAKERLFDIATDIARHFEMNLRPSKFKAMFATHSKFDAVRYYEIFKEFTGLRCAVVISNNEQDEDATSENKQYTAQAYAKILDGKDEREYERWAIDEFSPKDRHGEIDLLIVVDKLLTGFDAPRAKVLYVDKFLQEHSLLQAIARVNRIYEGKDCGLIMDYRGLLGKLNKAMNAYEALSGFDEGDLELTLQGIETMIDAAQVAYAKLDEFFAAVRGQDANSHCEFLMKFDTILQGLPDDYEKALAEALKQKQMEFKALLGEFARNFFTALGSEKIYDILGKNEIAEMKSKVKFYNEVRRILQQRMHEEMGLDEFEGLMQQLLDTYINKGGINQLGKIQNIFDDDFEAQVERILGEQKTDKAVADSIISALDGVIAEKFDENPAFYKSLGEKIRQVLSDYEQKRNDDGGLLGDSADGWLLGEAKKLESELKGGVAARKYPSKLGDKQGARVFFDNVSEFFGDNNFKKGGSANGVGGFKGASSGGLRELLGENFEDFCVDFALFCDGLYAEAQKKPLWQENADIKRVITLRLTEKRFEFEEKFGEKFTACFDEARFDELDKMLRKIAEACY